MAAELCFVPVGEEEESKAEGVGGEQFPRLSASARRPLVHISVESSLSGLSVSPPVWLASASLW